MTGAALRILGITFSGQAQYLVNFDGILKGSKFSFCETVVFAAGTALRMPPAHFSWQVQCFVDLNEKVAETWVKDRF